MINHGTYEFIFLIYKKNMATGSRTQTFIGLVAILGFILFLVLVFSFNDRLSANPYSVVNLFLLMVVLISVYFIIAYFAKWWPYRVSNNTNDKNYNNRILTIFIVIGAISLLLLFLGLYLGYKYDKEQIMEYVESVEQQHMVSEIPMDQYEPVPNSDIELSGREIKEPSPETIENQIKRLRQEMLLEQEQQRHIPPIQVEELERAEKELDIERLVLENQLGEAEIGPSEIEDIKNREMILKKEEAEGLISPEIVKEDELEAEIKTERAEEALKSELPSEELFSPESIEGLSEGTMFGPEASNILMGV